MGGRIIPFGDAIKQALNLSMPYGNIIIEVREVWEECVGAISARHTLPLRYTNGELTVLVDDSYWMSELKLYEREIIQKLGQVLSHRIQRISWKLVKELPQPVGLKKSFYPPVEPLSLQVSDEIRQKVEEAVGKLEDEELKSAMRKFFLQAFAMQQSLETEKKNENQSWR